MTKVKIGADRSDRSVVPRIGDAGHSLDRVFAQSWSAREVINKWAKNDWGAVERQMK